MWKNGVYTVAKGSYGIKTLNGSISGLDELFAKLDALPETATAAAKEAIDQGALAIAQRAKANTTDGLIAQGIDKETTSEGTKVKSSVFVSPLGHKTPLWPVFYEMGTGPKGIASGGDKYPLPASAYTQHPWTYWDEKLQHFVRTEGRYAQPYLWPAYQAEKPFVLPRVRDAIREFLTKKGGDGK